MFLIWIFFCLRNPMLYILLSTSCVFLLRVVRWHTLAVSQSSPSFTSYRTRVQREPDIRGYRRAYKTSQRDSLLFSTHPLTYHSLGTLWNADNARQRPPVQLWPILSRWLFQSPRPGGLMVQPVSLGRGKRECDSREMRPVWLFSHKYLISVVESLRV